MNQHLAAVAERVITDQHHAMAAQLVGEEAELRGGEILHLVEVGALAPGTVGGERVPGTRWPVDPWLMSVLMGVITAEAEPEDLPKLRRMSLAGWVRAVDALIEERLRGMAKSRMSDFFRDIALGIGDVLARVAGPPQSYLTPFERDAWKHARFRAGQHIKNISRRQLQVVRRELARAVELSSSPKEVAQILSDKLGKYRRDWLRVARTEMQAAYNEGVALTIGQRFGPNAQVARVPERDACEHCMRLFVIGGKPRTFKLSALIGNGTNVGRKAGAWKAVLHPVHPHCRCGVVYVPPGYKFDSLWRLRPATGSVAVRRERVRTPRQSPFGLGQR